MNCQSCNKEIVADTYFCTWCSDFVPLPQKGKRADLFSRWLAWFLDPLIAVLLYIIAIVLLGTLSAQLGIITAILFPLAYFVWFLMLLRKGLTPGKLILGLQVIHSQTGRIPGFGKMFLREVIGRFLSVLFLGLGYFWALFDKNSQAWHDKLAGTVVVKTR